MAKNIYEQNDANLEIPFIPNNTVIVYTAHIKSKIPIVSVTLVDIPKTDANADAKSGVAKENVVAVAHTIAKIATMSISLPKEPSTLFPKRGLTASENRCLSLFLTCIIKAKQIARTT